MNIIARAISALGFAVTGMLMILSSLILIDASYIQSYGLLKCLGVYGGIFGTTLFLLGIICTVFGLRRLLIIYPIEYEKINKDKEWFCKSLLFKIFKYIDNNLIFWYI